MGSSNTSASRSVWNFHDTASAFSVQQSLGHAVSDFNGYSMLIMTRIPEHSFKLPGCDKGRSSVDRFQLISLEAALASLHARVPACTCTMLQCSISQSACRQ